MLSKFNKHRKNITIPEHLSLTAELLWSGHEMDVEFLKTNCELTTFAIRDYLTPGLAYDDDIWISTSTLPNPIPDTFEIIFGDIGQEDHYMFFYKDVIYQSFAFVTKLMSTPFDPSLPFWRYVPGDEQYLFKDKQLRFLIQR